MNKDKREGWLANLKVGDEAYMYSGRYYDSDHEIVEIIGITPSGMIKIKDSKDKIKTFSHEGYIRGEESRYKYRLTEMTEELKNKLKRENFIKDLGYFVTKRKHENLSLEQLEAIFEIIKKEREE